MDSPYESVVVFFGDGSICEYPFSFMAEKCKGYVCVRSLSLTHYVCKNERRIAEASSWLPELSLNSWLKLVSFSIIFFRRHIILHIYHSATCNIFLYIVFGGSYRCCVYIFIPTTGVT